MAPHDLDRRLTETAYRLDLGLTIATWLSCWGVQTGQRRRRPPSTTPWTATRRWPRISHRAPLSPERGKDPAKPA